MRAQRPILFGGYHKHTHRVLAVGIHYPKLRELNSFVCVCVCTGDTHSHCWIIHIAHRVQSCQSIYNTLVKILCIFADFCYFKNFTEIPLFPAKTKFLFTICSAQSLKSLNLSNYLEFSILFLCSLIWW